MTKWFYLRSENRHPVACVALDTNLIGGLAYAVATHNPSDQYVKRTGRELAVGRLNLDPKIIQLPKSLPFRKLKQAIARDLLVREDTPERTRSAASLLFVATSVIAGKEKLIRRVKQLGNNPGEEGR